MSSLLSLQWRNDARPVTGRSVLASIPVSSFIAGLLVSDDPATLASALQMAQMLMDKLPDVFRK